MFCGAPLHTKHNSQQRNDLPDEYSKHGDHREAHDREQEVRHHVVRLGRFVAWLNIIVPLRKMRRSTLRRYYRSTGGSQRRRSRWTADWNRRGFTNFEACFAHEITRILVSLKPGFARWALALKMIGAKRRVHAGQVALVGVHREWRSQRTTTDFARKREERAAAFASRHARIRADFRSAIAALKQSHKSA